MDCEIKILWDWHSDYCSAMQKSDSPHEHKRYFSCKSVVILPFKDIGTFIYMSDRTVLFCNLWNFLIKIFGRRQLMRCL